MLVTGSLRGIQRNIRYNQTGARGKGLGKPRGRRVVRREQISPFSRAARVLDALAFLKARIMGRRGE